MRYLILSLLLSFSLSAQRGIGLIHATPQAQTFNRPAAEDPQAPGLYPAYQNVVDWAMANSITPPSAEENEINSTLYQNIDSFFKADWLHMYATSSNRSFAKINWATPGTFNATEVGTPDFTLKVGYKPAAGDPNYLKTGYTPSIHTNHYTLDSGTFGLVVYVESSISGSWMMGSRYGGGGDMLIRSNHFRINNDNSPSPVMGTIAGSDTMCITVSRAGANTYVYINGQQHYAGTSPVEALPALESWIIRANENNNPGGSFSEWVMAAFTGSYIEPAHQAAFSNEMKRSIWRKSQLAASGGGSTGGSTGGSNPGSGGGNPGNSEKLDITFDMVLAEYHATPTQAMPMFDGDLSTGATFESSQFNSPTFEAIPGTGLTGQCIILDLLGEYWVDSVRVRDANGNRFIAIYGGEDNIFELDSISSLTLDKYNYWWEIPVNKKYRYLVLNEPSNTLGGINEIEIWGERVSTDSVYTGEIVHKKLKDIWGITTHDYNHVPSVPPFQNTRDINFFRETRTYVEMGKSFDENDSLRKPEGATGSFSVEQLEHFDSIGGSLMLSCNDALKSFSLLYPYETRDGDKEDAPGDLPMFDWDTTLTFEENQVRMYIPSNWARYASILMQIADYINELGLDSTAIVQITNEKDKTWKSKYHRLNPFQLAALMSWVWDQHESGGGMRSLYPLIRIAGMAQAYNNTGYMKMMNMWFKHFRSDGEFCADIICSNAYCNNKSGFQWDPDAIAIPPEESEWELGLKRSSDFARTLGKFFALTEFGTDASGHSGNKNRVFIDSSLYYDWELIKDTTVAPYDEGQYSQGQYAYDSIFWPKWGDTILYYQSAWNLRQYLVGSQYCHIMHLYHLRDNREGYFNTASTYSSAGIAWRRDDYARGNLELKPSGIDLKHFYETLGDYYMTSLTSSEGNYTAVFQDDFGNTKYVVWTDAPDSKPVIQD